MLVIQICLFLNFNSVFLKNHTKTSTVNTSDRQYCAALSCSVLPSYWWNFVFHWRKTWKFPPQQQISGILWKFPSSLMSHPTLSCSYRVWLSLWISILGGKAAGVFKRSGIKSKNLRDSNQKSKYLAWIVCLVRDERNSHQHCQCYQILRHHTAVDALRKHQGHRNIKWTNSTH